MTPYETQHLRILRHIRLCFVVLTCLAAAAFAIHFGPDIATWLETYGRKVAIGVVAIIGMLMLPLAAWGLEALFKPRAKSRKVN